MSVPIPWCLTRFGACLRLNIEWSLIFFSIFFLLNKPFEFETGSTAAARAQQRKRDASAAEAEHGAATSRRGVPVCLGIGTVPLTCLCLCVSPSRRHHFTPLHSEFHLFGCEMPRQAAPKNRNEMPGNRDGPKKNTWVFFKPTRKVVFSKKKTLKG